MTLESRLRKWEGGVEKVEAKRIPRPSIKRRPLLAESYLESQQTWKKTEWENQQKQTLKMSCHDKKPEFCMLIGNFLVKKKHTSAPMIEGDA